MKKRLHYLDVIRIFACFCVLTIHFNASVSGYNQFGAYVYSNAVIPNNWFGTYLGSLGVGLFFMISGAALEYRYSEGCSPIQFYRRRLFALYPMFWVAYVISFVYSFLRSGEMPLAPVWHLLISVLGMDGYFMRMGFPGWQFYQLGEWFLGCILLIYLIYPLLSAAMHKAPVPTILVSSGIWVAITALKVNQNWFFVWAFYVELGMVFTRLIKRALKPGVGIAAAVLLAVRIIFNSLLPQEAKDLLLCILFFLGITAVCELMKNKLDKISRMLGLISGLTYPIFLVHHCLIKWMILPFNLQVFPIRYYIVLYLIYLFFTIILAIMLKKLTERISNFLGGALNKEG